ncbi:shikimate dehydrogenase [Oceanobacillus piezotolerans]|uniref:Shikimate dehydrogenase (NADP(+)) n=1 Tax=Oceanobacillus piezotolerans TaxID=2448030 RepID=A0A498DD99_9BACI|nr:shikimate dehydrogenase [Oceanobacillus piezotolerans]RLL48016.1 shikimate dehydrogenase [Oceanobacillus piezotolerans]
MGYRFALIGYPIKHSLSPWIHEEFLRKANLQGSYQINEIPLEGNFKEEILKLKEQQVDGFNVTVPYKQKIIPFLDKIDESVEKVGAVNTVAYEKGKWVGYNTDGMGYVRSLESKFSDSLLNKEQRILLLGAGGAARGIFHGLIDNGFRYIDFANRTMDKALSIRNSTAKPIHSNIMTLEEVEKHIHSYDMIIQTTSVGMNPNSEQSIINLENIRAGSIISDIVYQPIKTKFLKLGENYGGRIHFGHTMLLYQAQLAFEIWTGKKVKADTMDEKLQQILEGR